jgi:RHS repeat-associated protein
MHKIVLATDFQIRKRFHVVLEAIRNPFATYLQTWVSRLRPLWNPIGTLEDLTVTDPFSVGGNQSCSYVHDDLRRIESVDCGSAWAQTFSYDAFGNLSKLGSSSFQPTYSQNNRITKVGSFVPTYDLNGNVTNDSFHSYLWDASGKATTIDSVILTYDALGRMVEQNRGGAFSQIVYSPSGSKVAILNAMTLQKAFVPLPAGSAAVYTSAGLAYYRHADWLGSSRFASTPNRTMYFDGSYGPFGEPYAQTGTSDLSFTGMNQDTVPNLYDYPAREYSPQGRWPSPDPSGLSSVQAKDPQTWNRYAYTRNNPLSFVDPNGLCTAPPGGNGVCIDLYIPTPTVPGSPFGFTGLGDDRGPQSDGGTYREQYQITYDPSAGVVDVYSFSGVCQVELLTGQTLSSPGTIYADPPPGISMVSNPDGSVTVNIDTAAANGFVGYPGAPSATIDLSVSVTLNPDGTASVNPGGTYSGYPSLEIFNYQQGQAPTPLITQAAGQISQLGSNSTPIQDDQVDSPIDGSGGGDGGGGGGGSDDIPDPQSVDQSPALDA